MTAPNPINDTVREWLKEHHRAVFVTLRRDGSPQTSNLSYVYDGDTFRISVTDDRAKTNNARRDPRVVLHVLGDSFWQYVSIQATASVGEVTTEPGDAAGQELLEVYEGIAGPHPDHDEYFAAMVKDRRLILTLTPIKAVANGL